MLLALIHSHVQSVPCNFSSVDVHTQHTFAKIHNKILGLVVELKENGQQSKYAFFEMSQQGSKLVEKCSRRKDCNTREQHQSCNNDRIYKSALENVIIHDDTLLEVRNFMGGSIEFQNIQKPMDTEDQLDSEERKHKSSQFTYSDDDDSFQMPQKKRRHRPQP